MSAIVVLDSTPLGLVTNPKGGADAEDCTAWLNELIDAQVRIVVPEIVDYELRREFLRTKKTNALRRLDEFNKDVATYLPITTPAMLKAAEFWATLRQDGKPGAADTALDADVILAAQAFGLTEDGQKVVIATENVKYLQHRADARHWRAITLESLQQDASE